MRIAAILATIIGLALAAPATARAADVPNPVAARLLAETASVAPGTILWVDLDLAIAPGWHIYWRNPGDSGLPTAIAWTLPEGIVAGAMDWPAPERFVEGGIGSYGYAGKADLLVPIHIPKGLASGGDVALGARASWLVCKDICIPGSARLGLSLPVAAGPSGPDPATAPLFAAARRELPVPAPFETRFATRAGAFRLIFPARALAGLGHPTALFFPLSGTLIDHAVPEPLTMRRAGGLALTLTRAKIPGGKTAAAPATLDGVLVLHAAAADGKAPIARAYAISANPVAAAADPPGGARVPWQALLLAFLGGILLNLMPCVFPILSLKVLNLAQGAHTRRAVQRRQGLAYGAGVVASFALLGGVLLALREGGAAIGWGFQLQSPVVVGLLAYLLFAMGLSLSGVFELGGGIVGSGSRLATLPGLAGNFFTGVLATVVAAPCTAPFMGAALGFALVAPLAVALGIFAALGIGLAAPFVLLSMVPGLERVLPRPGAWMAVFRQLLAFPLYGTVVWLVWVLIQEVGPEGSLAALAGLVLVAFAAWAYGGTRLARSGTRRFGAGLALAGAAGAIALATMVVPASLAAASAGHTAALSRDTLPSEPFTDARLAALEAAHKPVFVYLTASWCITCLVNEHAVLDTASMRRAFAARGIVALRGDWTRQNPQITRFLQRFGRSGVPLYVYYDGSRPPVVLPQLLTASRVLATIGTG